MYIDALKRLLLERISCLKRICVCPPRCSSLMSKVTVKKVQWCSRVQESFVPLTGGSGELGVAVGGGADYGEFPFITAAPGGVASVGDILLEVSGTPVLGMTLGDVRGVLNSCPHPVRIKTVSPDSTLCKDLRLYLSRCFTPGSADSQQQQVIRENLYLRAVPCTTRKLRDGEISGLDYSFVTVEEFFSLEESGVLLESGKFKGNYYGTPRPVHISPDSPPITYQEHRKLLKRFHTRNRSLSRLEKQEEGENSEEDSGLSGESVAASRAPLLTPSPNKSHTPRREGRSLSDGGWLEYNNSFPQSPNWLQRGDAACNSYLPPFTEHPSELRGYSIHTRLCKKQHGFGFNIVGGSRPREFLQVYSVTPRGPNSLCKADILVSIGETCVLGMSHREVVEILKEIPVGHSVDVVVRRGYPMLYTSDGCPRRPRPASADAPPTTRQPRSLPPREVSLLLSQAGWLLDANGNTSSSGSPAHLVPQQRFSSCHSDSEVTSARSSTFSRNHNNNSLRALPTLPGERSPIRVLPVSPLGSGSHSSVFLAPPSDSPARRRSGSTSSSTSLCSIPSPNGCIPKGRAEAELVTVTVGRSEAGAGLGFSVTAGGSGGRLAMVRTVWDRNQCPGLHPGDAILRVNGDNVQKLSVTQVERILQEQATQGKVVLLLYRRCLLRSSLSTTPHQPPLLAVTSGQSPLSPPVLTPPAPSLHLPVVVQSTSFLDSVPISFTLEPRETVYGGREGEGASVPRGVEVELRRRPGEGFGFVIASQEVPLSGRASLSPHRFVTVRRGSPAARSGLIRPGDRLQGVEGHTVVSLPHRELAQMLRGAGTSLRLHVAPRSHTHSSSISESSFDGTYRNSPRPKLDCRYYSVDLERGPSGFGFSLRGGSEYSMGLYVLALMEDGPAAQSCKMQVSDQLMEINGGSTAGMSHSQAVEQIRRVGRYLHLVLKKGNGYVPDYVELSSLSLCMTSSRLGEPCFYVIGRTESMRP